MPVGQRNLTDKADAQGHVAAHAGVKPRPTRPRRWGNWLSRPTARHVLLDVRAGQSTRRWQRHVTVWASRRPARPTRMAFPTRMMARVASGRSTDGICPSLVQLLMSRAHGARWRACCFDVQPASTRHMARGQPWQPFSERLGRVGRGRTGICSDVCRGHHDCSDCPLAESPRPTTAARAPTPPHASTPRVTSLHLT